MIAATILPIAGARGDPERAIALASALALLVGTITAVAGIARLGFVADLISKPTILGYMNGLAVTILVSQLPKLFGFSVEGDNFLDDVNGFVEGLADGETVAASLAIGLFGLVLIVGLQRRLPKVPGVLLAVVLSTLAAVLELSDHGVSVVGVLPQGLPPFTLPDIGFSDIGLLFGGALGIALVSLTDTISTASSFAARSGDEIDGQREMIGIGASNIAAGFFQGFPVSTSGSRTAVAEQAGAKTQVTGVVGAGAIMLILLFFPGLLRDLPQPTLAAVVITASLSLADVPATIRLTRCAGPSSCCASPPSSASSSSACSPASRSPSPCRSETSFVVPGGLTRPSWDVSPASPGTTTCAATRPRSYCRTASSSGSTHRCSLRTRGHSASRYERLPDPSPLRHGSSSPPSRSPTWTRPPPTCSRS
jgi:MFS superfamily sulfate permease-like transporter